MEKNCKLFHDRWKLHEIQISVSIKFYWNTAMPIHLRFLWLFDATTAQSRNPCLLLKMWIRSIPVNIFGNDLIIKQFSRLCAVVSQRNTRWKQRAAPSWTKPDIQNACASRSHSYLSSPRGLGVTPTSGVTACFPHPSDLCFHKQTSRSRYSLYLGLTI